MYLTSTKEIKHLEIKKNLANKSSDVLKHLVTLVSRRKEISLNKTSATFNILSYMHA